MNRLRVREEEALYQRLHDFFGGTVAAFILQNVAVPHDQHIRARLLQDGCVPLEAGMSPSIPAALETTRDRLSFTAPLELMWDQHAEAPARAIPSSTSEAHNFVVLSPAVSEFDPDQLRFVLGHEIGHILFRHQVLRWIFDVVYPHRESVPPFVRNEYDLWTKCAEFSSDRAGAHAAGSIDAAAAVLSRLPAARRPTPAERIAGLKNPTEINRMIRELEPQPQSDFDRLALAFMTAAGELLIRADGELSGVERAHLLNRVSRYGYAGRLAGVFSDASDTEGTRDTDTISASAQRAANELRTRYPERLDELFLNLTVIVARDGIVTDEEYELLSYFGRSLLGIDDTRQTELILRVFRSEFFRPLEE